ncbi:hypothetical protein H6G17_07920 [Chroococcidiopsis sp. FACHB-1243]|uniref:hypothetical protein n=1 Tax=Chroococcidiopsis sp. [FACHB-1243] TaxID=2692781 RepID=UPI001784081E|nr:hypothetical protein [Chroococcidiopsis sp. [FACHB-1243]]MBD2305438.1 hypothetical protein [Chroococcidiopsis sp. [FACHB-1243]]
MTSQPSMPDPDKVKQTVANSRRRRIEMELAGLELEEVIAKLEHYNRQQQMQRLKRVLNGDATESQPFKQNPVKVSS